MDLLWMIAVVAVMVGLYWLGWRIDPHWSTKDGRRFMCNAQTILGGQPSDRFRETTVQVLGDGSLHVTRKRAMRRKRSSWNLIGKSPDPPPKYTIYLASQVTDGRQAAHELLALKIPNKSRCIPVLDAALEQRQVSRRPSPGSVEPAAPPDPDR